MKYKERFSLFLEKYSFRELLVSAETLIKNLLKNILNSGNIAWQIVLSPVLLLAIFLLFLIIVSKKLLLNLHNLLHWLYKLQRNLLVIAVQEINFYWVKAGKAGSDLVATLSTIIKRMSGYVRFLLQKVFDDSVTYTRENDTGNLILVGTAAASFAIWLAMTLLALVATVLLLFTFFTGLPLLHRSLRPQITQPNLVQDSPAITNVRQGAEITDFVSHPS